MRRRALLKFGGCLAGMGGLAGCLDGGGTTETPGGAELTPAGAEESTATIPSVEDPPDAIYKPTHREGTIHGEAKSAGEFVVAPMYAVPHEFLLVDTAGGERVTPSESDDLHVMIAVWDPETGIPFPSDSGLTITIENEDGAPVVPAHGPWPMLSQGMGFHFGDNVSLDGEGTYTLQVSVPPLDGVRRVGDIAGRFETRGEAEFAVEFGPDFRNELVESIEYLDESEWGEPGAIEPMHGGGRDGEMDHDGEMDGGDGEGMDDGGDSEMDGHGMPYPDSPHAEMLPGELLGTPESDGAVVATTLVEPGTRFADESYLLVSPRTKHNSGVLPQMKLSATVRRDGETVATRDLRETLDHEAEFHYGEELADVEPGDEIELTVETPPLAARHVGYDTALVDMPAVTVTIPE